LGGPFWTLLFQELAEAELFQKKLALLQIRSVFFTGSSDFAINGIYKCRATSRKINAKESYARLRTPKSFLYPTVGEKGPDRAASSRNQFIIEHQPCR
jgi:hypothetical protein